MKIIIRVKVRDGEIVSDYRKDYGWDWAAIDMDVLHWYYESKVHQVVVVK